ncbi:MAG: radical SAM family heme chaperone HemW [Candidatus Gastranaerophilales bacterium]|nr:radical SAM family heme chaperone HemW [Candidatus Gastranaerophilales bacterium]
MVKNAYIHIPFCKSKCNYCSFVSFCNLGLKNDYLNALKKQIKAEYQGESLNTIYFGGGTPSLLSIDEFRELLDLFNLNKDVEITFEANPDDANLEYSKNLMQLGVNRLSLGVQTFDDKILQIIGRRHNAVQTLFALHCAAEAGFDNINIDLIHGLPTQSLADFVSDLQKVEELGIHHVSLYGLKIEDGCYFYKNLPSCLPDLDLQADMYLKAVEVLKDKGFEHYEISNFSLPGFNSKHNLNYWNNNTYYGFGCSASGYSYVVGQVCPTYETAVRYTNEINLKKYIQNPLNKFSKQHLSEQEILEEAIFLGFRKIAGINVEEINKKFDIDFDEKYSKILEQYSEFFIKTQTGWALTTKGILISNEILAQFIAD